MNKDILLDNRLIGNHSLPYIIAELSANHDGSFEKAIKTIDAAKKSGADSIKIQTFTADTLTLNVDRDEFIIKDEKSLWRNQTLYSLYEKASMSWEWIEKIFKYCSEIGITCFSSVFDFSSLEFLEKINCPFYKIGSFENIDLPLIKKTAETQKPIIVSLGMASLSEINDIVETVISTGNKNLVLLKCTSTYPATPNDTNLATIPVLRETFDSIIGLSDHTMGIGASIASIAMGSCVIEKHFTLSRDSGGVDSTFSLEYNDMKSLVDESIRAWQAVGKVTFNGTKSERLSKKFRRSLYAIKDIEQNEVFSYENVRSIRPGLGLKPKYSEIIYTKSAKYAIKKGEPILWDLIR